ncbi:MAG TPA: DCC1-like thiol-disulfide oxidoreductase family protein [Bacteroidales bacterium]|nr:DCC1-like thiol-disulfide oxidoreductase family protein [Bacteroidales bacterium]
MSDKKPGADTPVILYDEYCNLCSATVKFVLRNDPRGKFSFLGLRSGKRKKWYPLSVNEGAFKSVILVENGEKYYRSGAVLRIFRRLRFPVNLLYGFVLVPRFIRDPLYNRIAKNRFRWFGRREAPLEVAPRWKDRFMDS